MAEIVCAECGYQANVTRTGPHSAKPEHDFAEFERLCREGPFETLAATGCYRLDNAPSASFPARLAPAVRDLSPDTSTGEQHLDGKCGDGAESAYDGEAKQAE